MYIYYIHIPIPFRWSFTQRREYYTERHPVHKGCSRFENKGVARMVCEMTTIVYSCGSLCTVARHKYVCIIPSTLRPAPLAHWVRLMFHHNEHLIPPTLHIPIHINIYCPFRLRLSPIFVYTQAKYNKYNFIFHFICKNV